MNTKHILFSVLVGLCLFGCFGWYDNHNCEGIPPNGWGTVYRVTETKDGNFILVGAQKEEEWAGTILKLDKDGNKIWKKEFAEDGIDSFHYIIQTTDGSLIVADFNEIVKFDKDVTKIWKKKTIGDIYGITQTNDANFVVLTSKTLLKLDKNGKTIWERPVSGIQSIIATSTGIGNFAVIGRLKNSKTGLFSSLIRLLDKDGKTIWEKTFDSDIPKYSGDFEYFVETADKGFVVLRGTGFTSILKLDKDGNTIYSKKIKNYSFNDIIQTADRGFILSTNEIFYKYDKNFNFIWHNYSLNDLNKDDRMVSIESAPIETKDGSFLVVGYKNTPIKGHIPYDKNALVIKLDKDGKTIWEKTFGGTYINCPPNPVD